MDFFIINNIITMMSTLYKIQEPLEVEDYRVNKFDDYIAWTHLSYAGFYCY